MSLLFELFLSFLQIGLFSFGGGYAAMPLIQSQVVELHGWITTETFANLVTIAEMTPGPIAINAATFVGTQVAGLPGALAATIGCVLPSCLILIVLSLLYQKYGQLDMIQGIMGGLRPAVVAMIASAGLTILISALRKGGSAIHGIGDIHPVTAVLFVLALIGLRWKKPSPILVMLAAGAVGIAIYLITGQPVT